MKLDFDDDPSTLLVSAYGDGWVSVGDRRIEQPCVVAPARLITDALPPQLEGLAQSHMTTIAALEPEIVLLGTGRRQVFVDAALTLLLAEHGAGLEVMDTGAACRSYNILASEGRAVVAALYMI
ncbi:MAG: Mth938-like domain-containing protein [Gammaproteobacteria bacterium]